MDQWAKRLEALYQETPMAVLLLSGDLSPVWANPYAKEHTPLLCSQEYLEEHFFLQGKEELLARLSGGEVVRLVKHRFLTDPMEVVLYPCREDGALQAVEAHFFPKGGEGPLQDRAEETIDMAVSRLREPLADLFALTDPLVRSLRQGAKPEHAMGYIQEMVRRYYRMLANLVNLSEYSRYIDGTSALRLKREDLAEHLRSLCDASQLFLMGVGYQLTFTAKEEPLFAYADYERIDVALLNLLCNACLHTAAPGEVTVSLSRSGDQAVITVSDTGPGMEEAQLGQVLQPWRFSQQDGMFLGNAGLGLGVARGIAQLHGGSLVIASSQERGTVVSLRIPLRLQALPQGEEGELHSSPELYLQDRFSAPYIFLSGLPSAISGARPSNPEGPVSDK